MTEHQSSSAVKRCPRCGETKTAEHFPKDKRSKSGLYAYCYPCKNDYGKERWHRSNEVRDKAYIATLEKRYGLAPERYQAIFDGQGGRCAICRCDPRVKYAHLSPSYRRLHVDHWHDDTTAVRGLLCQNCNFGVGRWLDNPQLLKAAIRYLDKHIPLRIGEVS